MINWKDTVRISPTPVSCPSITCLSRALAEWKSLTPNEGPGISLPESAEETLFLELCWSVPASLGATGGMTRGGGHSPTPVWHKLPLPGTEVYKWLNSTAKAWGERVKENFFGRLFTANNSLIAGNLEPLTNTQDKMATQKKTLKTLSFHLWMVFQVQQKQEVKAKAELWRCG